MNHCRPVPELQPRNGETSTCTRSLARAIAAAESFCVAPPRRNSLAWTRAAWQVAATSARAFETEAYPHVGLIRLHVRKAIQSPVAAPSSSMLTVLAYTAKLTSCAPFWPLGVSFLLVAVTHIMTVMYAAYDMLG